MTAASVTSKARFADARKEQLHALRSGFTGRSMRKNRPCAARPTEPIYERRRWKTLWELRRLNDIARLAGRRLDAFAHVDQVLLDTAETADDVIELLLDRDGLGTIRPGMEWPAGIVGLERHTVN
jgi:hypothetical protein